MFKINDLVNKVGTDKFIHLLVCVIIAETVAVCDVTIFNRSAIIAATLGVIVAIFAGIGKEVIDFFRNGLFDFKDLKFVLKAAKGNAPAVTLNYGNFIQCTIDFIIVAIAIFAVIKAMNALRTLAIKEKKEADEITPLEPTKEEALLTEIRDILKEKNK